jgi:hypothetical protein
MSELIRGISELLGFVWGVEKMTELIGGTSELWGFVWEIGKNE